MMKEELLRLEHIDKTVENYAALKDFRLTIFKGEIISLVGLSGCGKTELANILSGVDVFNSGRFFFNGLEYSGNKTIPSDRIGIMTITNKGILIPQLTVAENIYVVSKKISKHIILNRKKVYQQTNAALKEFGITQIKPSMQAQQLTEAQKQIVKLIKAYVKNIKLVIMDNVAEAYTSKDIRLLISTLRILKNNGISILWLSNIPNKISTIADRVIVMRHGQNVKTIYHMDYDPKYLHDLLIGHAYHETASRHTLSTGPVVFEIHGLSSQHLKNITFQVCQGEIVGVLDIDSLSLLELEQVLTGQARQTSGFMSIQEKTFAPRNLDEAVKSIGYIRGTNLEDSIFTNLSALSNITLPILKKTCKYRMLINPKVERFINKKYLSCFPSKVLADKSRLKEYTYLKQLIVYRRWLLAKPKMMLCVEPFARVDLPTRMRVYQFYRDFVQAKIGALILSVNLKDLVSICDKIILMQSGIILKTYKKENFNDINTAYFLTQD